MIDNNAFLWNYYAGLPDSDSEDVRKGFNDAVRAMEQQDFRKALGILKKCLKKSSTQSDRAALQLLIGNALAGMGKIQEAVDSFSASEETAEKAGDIEGRTAACFNMSAIEKARGETGAATRILLRGLSLAATSKNARAKIDFLDSLADIAMSESNTEKAYNYFSQAFEAEKEMRDTIGMAYHLSCLGHLFQMEDEIEKAIEKYNESLSLYEEIEDQWGEANCLDRLSNLCLEAGDADQASISNERALEIFRELGDTRGEAGALLTSGAILSQQGERSPAIENMEKALVLFSNMGDRASQADCFYEMGFAYYESCEPELAEQFLLKSLKIYNDLNIRRSQADALSSLGRLCLDGEDFPEAKQYFDRSITISKEIKDPLGEANTLQYLANAFFHLNDIETAVSHLKHSREIYVSQGDIEGVKMVEKNMAWIEENR